MRSLYLTQPPKETPLEGAALVDYQQWSRHPRTLALLEFLESKRIKAFHEAIGTALTPEFNAEHAKAQLLRFHDYDSVINHINNPTA